MSLKFVDIFSWQIQSEEWTDYAFPALLPFAVILSRKTFTSIFPLLATSKNNKNWNAWFIGADQHRAHQQMRNHTVKCIESENYSGHCIAARFWSNDVAKAHGYGAITMDLFMVDILDLNLESHKQRWALAHVRLKFQYPIDLFDVFGTWTECHRCWCCCCNADPDRRSFNALFILE